MYDILIKRHSNSLQVKSTRTTINVTSYGKRGIQGIQGIQGIAGNNGIDGIDGINGVDGSPGATGPQGPAGDPASNIITSVNGKTGAVVLNSDDIDDSTASHKFVTAAQKALINSASQPGDNLSSFNNDSGFITNLSSFSTTNLVEGTRLYYTDARVQTYGDAHYQPLDSDLTTLASLSATTNNFIVGVSSAWASRTPAQVRTTLGLEAGGAGDIWVKKAGDTMSGKLAFSGISSDFAIDTGGFGIKANKLIIDGTPKSFQFPYTLNGVQPETFIYLDSQYNVFRIGAQSPSSIASISFELPNNSEYQDVMSISKTSLAPASALTNSIALGGSGNKWKSLYIGTSPSTIEGTLTLGALSGVLKASTGLISGGAVLGDLGSTGADFSMNSHKLTSLTDPTNPQDAATKFYVDSVATGLDVKASVRVATTANITLSGAQTIDGVSAIAGDRVLVKNQSTGSQNGIYIVAAGSWSRSTDADASAEVTGGMFTFVTQGTTNADSGWTLTTDDPITLGSTALVFTQFSGAGQITAGNGLSKSGNTLTINTSITVDKTTVQTLTNKTLTSPAITTPTGIVKGDIGLGNVDNTSDATKNAASVTLTNKTLTSPVINTPTGIVKGDVGLGNVDNTSDATKNAATATLTNKIVEWTPLPGTDLTVSGNTAKFTTNEAQAFGDMIYVDSAGKSHIGKADAIATAMVIGMAIGSYSSAATGTYLLRGFARNDAWNWTVGSPVYLTITGTTGNTLSQTAPTATNNCVVIVGIAIAADEIYVNPQLVIVELN